MRNKKEKILALQEIMDRHPRTPGSPGYLYLNKTYDRLVCHYPYKWNNKLKRYLRCYGCGRSVYSFDFDQVDIMIRKIKIENICKN